MGGEVEHLGPLHVIPLGLGFDDHRRNAASVVVGVGVDLLRFPTEEPLLRDAEFLRGSQALESSPVLGEVSPFGR